jgi:colicin import membrane protein
VAQNKNLENHMQESADLLVIEKLELVPFFTKGDGIDSVLEQIAKEARSIVHDVSTQKGRDAVKANVTRVTKSKTYLEAQGKALAAEYKEIPKKIDANRKAVWDYLDNLQKEVRKPLTDWEDEQARIKAEEDARLAAIENQRVIDSDYEIALLLMERDFKQRQEQAEESERIRLASEQKMKDEAAAKAKADAEKAAQELIDKSESDRLAAVEREKQAEAAKIFAEQQLITQKAAADKAIIEADKKRLADIEAAKQLEIQRQADAKAAEEKKLAEAAANTAHVAAVNRAIKEVYIAAGFPEELAIKAVKLLVNNKLPHTTFNY